MRTKNRQTEVVWGGTSVGIPFLILGISALETQRASSHIEKNTHLGTESPYIDYTLYTAPI